jgi:RNA exonuclease 1
MQHVFTEKEIDQLHTRHAFTPSSTTETDTALEIAAIDCEGVYTTQGMSVARVSVCDGTGKVVFDELIRPDEGVEVMYDLPSFFLHWRLNP